MPMKGKNAVLIRLGRVLYVITILTGLCLALHTGYRYRPITVTVYRESIHCTNGKSFYSDSKPIYPNDGYQYIPPADTKEREISSECQFGTAYYIGDSVNLNLKNHTEEYIGTKHTEGSWILAIRDFFLIFILVFLIADVTRRTLRYILFGKSFFSLK